jgi:ubiquinone/menaquinone biosynthesis C-methylase UbiE
VCCLVLCSVADRPAALREVRRVLRPGGVLAFLEHERAGTPVLRTVQRVADATVWPLLTGGCHTATDPVGDITAAGLEVTELRRLRFPDTRIAVPVTPHVLGTARRA